MTRSTIVVDLYSDTVTRPTPEMRRFTCEVEVGDERKFEDPTVNQLVDGGRVAGQGGGRVPALGDHVQ